MQAVVDDARQFRVLDERHLVDVFHLIALDEQVLVQLFQIRNEHRFYKLTVAFREIVFDVEYIIRLRIEWRRVLCFLQSLRDDVQIHVAPMELLEGLPVVHVGLLHLRLLARLHRLLRH